MTSGNGVKQAAVSAGRGCTRSLSNYCLSIMREQRRSEIERERKTKIQPRINFTAIKRPITAEKRGKGTVTH